jgi:hypothetical protein
MKPAVRDLPVLGDRKYLIYFDHQVCTARGSVTSKENEHWGEHNTQTAAGELMTGSNLG